MVWLGSRKVIKLKSCLFDKVKLRPKVQLKKWMLLRKILFKPSINKIRLLASNTPTPRAGSMTPVFSPVMSRMRLLERLGDLKKAGKSLSRFASTNTPNRSPIETIKHKTPNQSPKLRTPTRSPQLKVARSMNIRRSENASPGYQEMSFTNRAKSYLVRPNSS